MRETPQRALQLLGYNSFRAVGYPKLLPINLTVSVTYSCPSRCKTCDIWQKKVDDLRVDEYARVFRSLGHSPMWVTVSGGDQFLREDLPEIFRLIRHILRPSVINLPMNGLITKRIHELLPRIARETVGSQLVLNLSIDDIGERHDELRGAKRNYQKILDTFRFVRELQREHKHIAVGIHTVISKFNVERIPEIYEELIQLQPDSYLTEIAEQRVELGTLAKDITPSAEDYAKAADFLTAKMRTRRSKHPVGRLVESLRLEYYELVKRTLVEKTQVIPCFAGWASAHLAPDGDVWGCCVRAEPLGNVRQTDYDFGKVWFSGQAEAFRRSVRAKECACPLANAAYTNMLLSPRSVARVARNYVRPASGAA
ncbi:radical SAM protein [Myxococcaceae bacterium GXIMD 01537]